MVGIGNAESLRKTTESKYKNLQFASSIIGTALQAAGDRKYQCQWYTPNYYECTMDDIDYLVDFTNKLQEDGYKARLYVLRPNETFDTTRVKITINWE